MLLIVLLVVSKETVMPGNSISILLSLVPRNQYDMIAVELHTNISHQRLGNFKNINIATIIIAKNSTFPD